MDENITIRKVSKEEKEEEEDEEEQEEGHLLCTLFLPHSQL